MDFKLGKIIALLGKTMPFLVFRFVIYFAITLGYILVTGIGALVGFGIGSIGGDAGTGGAWGGIVGFGLAATAMYFLREYLLYLVKAGHVAVLVELMEGRELPEGKGQINYAQGIVRERFVQSSVLFGLDQLIKGILRAFNRAFFTITSFLPIPGIQGLAKFVNTVVNLSLTYLDEVILAYNLKTRADNPWSASRTALVLYAQNYKVFLKNAFWLAFVIWGATFLVFLLCLLPAAALVALFPGTAGGLTLLLALVLAWGIKQALIEPLGMTALMQVFFKVTEGQQANPEWEAKLEKVSGKFAKLKDKAVDWAAGSGGRTAPDQAAAE